MSKNKRVGIPKKREVTVIIKDLDKPIYEVDGEQVFEVIQSGVKDDGQVDVKEIRHTLKSAIVRALRRLNPNKKLDDLEKAARGFLSEKIHLAKSEVEIDAEEVISIKEAVADYFSAADVIMQIHRIVDPACVPEKYRIKETEKTLTKGIRTKNDG